LYLDVLTLDKLLKPWEARTVPFASQFAQACILPVEVLPRAVLALLLAVLAVELAVLAVDWAVLAVDWAVAASLTPVVPRSYADLAAEAVAVRVVEVELIEVDSCTTPVWPVVALRAVIVPEVVMVPPVIAPEVATEVTVPVLLVLLAARS
jgi:hypothetical protein